MQTKCLLIPVVLSSSHCSERLVCGEGTVEANGECVVDVKGDASLSGDVATPDGGDAVDAGGRQEGASADVANVVDVGNDGDLLWRCRAQCDCPSGTRCSVDERCEGVACTQGCRSDIDCPCGRACTAGYCDFPVGSLVSCSMPCACPRGEHCVEGRCLAVCGRVLDCQTDSECAACGKVCEPFQSFCTRPGETCFCDSSCAAAGLDGQICDGQTKSCRAPGGVRVAFAGGSFGPLSAGERTYRSSVQSAVSGTATRAVVVIDMSVDIRDLQIEAVLTLSDGTRRGVPIRTPCGLPGETRWSGPVVFPAPTPKSGRFQLEVTNRPLDPRRGAAVSAAWVFFE